MAIDREKLHKQSPYQGLSKREAAIRMALEIPSGMVSSINHYRPGRMPSLANISELITRSMCILNDQGANQLSISDGIRVEGYLARGFESVVVSFLNGSARWVAKIGYARGFAVGMASPASNEYAELQRWNYAVLDTVYTSRLPNLLPRPYFILSPEELGCSATVQIAPFVTKIGRKRWTVDQINQLMQEKMLFVTLSQHMLSTYGVIPDLVMPNNIIVGSTGNVPHLVMLDIGLFNMRAPTPLLNLMAYTAFKLMMLKNRIDYVKKPELT